MEYVHKAQIILQLRIIEIYEWAKLIIIIRLSDLGINEFTKYTFKYLL